MPSSANGNAAPLPQHNITGNTTHPLVTDKSDTQESSTGPIQHEAAMQNTPGPASIQPILAAQPCQHVTLTRASV